MATAEGLAQTVRIKGKRYYKIGEDRLLPSVTTIISSMTDNSGIAAWRERVGNEEADRIGKYSANRGTVMHQMIEYFLLSKESTKSKRLKEAQIKILEFSKKEGFTDAEIEEGRSLFYKLYNNGTFNKIKELIALEEMLYCTIAGGYAGRVDAIYRRHDSGIIITDFKSSNKPKKLEWITKYYLQACAYLVAYWQMTGEKPVDCEIWISNVIDDEPQIFSIGAEQIKKSSHEFLSLVKRYHKIYS